MKYLIHIKTEPNADLEKHLCGFMSALYQQQHQLEMIFFYGDGAQFAQQHNYVDIAKYHELVAMSQRHCLAMHVCVNSAKSRHIELAADSPFSLSSLSNFAHSAKSIDRMLTL